jgi:3-hydroxyacyl-CoA dehydrogenase/enoyl-CoA hydratase/carnithine racemase
MAQVFTCKNEDGVAVIRFDVPGELMNTWTEGAIADFAVLLGVLEKEKDRYRGVIFISGKDTNFHAGANLNMLSAEKNFDDFRKGCDQFNALFMRLENLGIPTVAAIHGPCMGGGYEFALTMTARIATNSKRTSIGLPECNVGVIPGAGGTQRLPRLIGYPSLDFIPRGTVLPAVKALEVGMIDRVIPEGDDLLTSAKAFLAEIIAGTANLRREKPDLSALDAALEAAKKNVLKATREREIPAPMLALKAMSEGLRGSIKDGLKIETDCFIEALKAPESKGMINTFFLKTLSDKPKAMIPKGFEPKPIRKFGVLGFGTMGRGIIINIITRTKLPVVVKDVPQALDPGMGFIRKILEGMEAKYKLKDSVDNLLTLVKPVTAWTEDFKDVDVVIEAVFEDPAVKTQVYKELCQVVSEDCILATNTSSLPVDKLAASVLKPERFVGAHFFSPVWMMELLEVIQGKATSEATVNNMLAVCAAMGKRPVVCKDNPGFVVNAMLFPYFIKSFELLAEGVPMEKIDAAMLKFGLPVGPIRLTDEVGIDVSYLVLTKSLGVVPPRALENVYKAGRYGRNKNGKGFYTKGGSPDPEVLPLIYSDNKQKEYSVAELQDMLFTPFVKTGYELLKKQVVSDPRSIDIGAIWGIGFPADKGGPMKWADLTGLSEKLYGEKFYRK